MCVKGSSTPAASRAARSLMLALPLLAAGADPPAGCPADAWAAACAAGTCEDAYQLLDCSITAQICPACVSPCCRPLSPPPPSLPPAPVCDQIRLRPTDVASEDRTWNGPWCASFTTDAEVWLVAGEGRVLPERLWQALTDRHDQAGEPWELDEEIVPLSLVDHVVGPKGKESVDAMLRRTDAPVVPELLKQTL